MKKAQSKGELVTAAVEQGKIQLETTQVKFDAKISTKDLIEAAVFETEDTLLAEQDRLEALCDAANKKCNELHIKKDKIRMEFIKKYKNKSAEDLLKKLNEFVGGGKDKVQYHDYGDTDKGDISMHIFLGKHSNYSKEEEVTKSNDLKKAEQAYEDAKKERAKINNDIAAVSKQLQQIPRIKKRVQAGFVKNLVSGGLTPDEVFQKLREEMMTTVVAKK